MLTVAPAPVCRRDTLVVPFLVVVAKGQHLRVAVLSVCRLLSPVWWLHRRKLPPALQELVAKRQTQHAELFRQSHLGPLSKRSRLQMVPPGPAPPFPTPSMLHWVRERGLEALADRACGIMAQRIGHSAQSVVLCRRKMFIELVPPLFEHWAGVAPWYVM